MTIIGKSIMHISKPFTKRIMSRNYSVFLRNRLRCEKWTETKRNCLVRACYMSYTKTIENEPDKDPKKKPTPPKEKYKEYMDTVGDRKGLVKKSTNFGKIFPVGLLNDFKNSSKILIIPINCEQDQIFLERPETIDAIKLIRKHFKEIETFAEYSKPYITVLRNPEVHDQNILQALPTNTEAAGTVMHAAITDIASGKPVKTKFLDKDLKDLLKNIQKANPHIQKFEINEYDEGSLHEKILKKIMASTQVSPDAMKSTGHEVAVNPTGEDAAKAEVPKASVEVKPQSADVGNSANADEPKISVEAMQQSAVVGNAAKAEVPTAGAEVNQPTADVGNAPKAAVNRQSAVAGKTSNQQPTIPVITFSRASEQLLTSEPKNLVPEETAASAQSITPLTEEGKQEEGYIKPYPVTMSVSEAESKPSITSITFDFETDLFTKEQISASEQLTNVAMNIGVATPDVVNEKQLIPVNFSAVITGFVKMPAEKVPNEQVSNMEPEELNKLIGEILNNLGEGTFQTKDVLKQEVATSFMVAPQVREECPYSDGGQLMDASVYKRAVEEAKKIKKDVTGPLVVEMKASNDSCKVCTSKGTTCSSKKSESNCDKKDAPKKASPCGGQEKPEKPKCKPAEEKTKKGCEGGSTKAASPKVCGAKLKPNKPCPPKKNPECDKQDCKKEECIAGDKKCSNKGSCGQANPDTKDKCGGEKNKKKSPCGASKAKTTPKCDKKDSSNKSCSNPKGQSPCSGCDDNKDKWDMSSTFLLCPVINCIRRNKIFNQYSDQVRWFKLIPRLWSPKEDVIINKRLCIVGRRSIDLELDPIDVKDIKDGEVLIEVDTVALTGSDLFLFETGNRSLTMGHGSSGTVTHVGPQVRNLTLGDKVAIEPAVPCGICEKCLGGLYNVCPNIVFKGALAKYCIHPAIFCHKLPESVSLEDASLINTLATGYQACVKANITAKSNLIVIGSCPLALATVMCARAMGAAKIVITSAIHTNTSLAERIGGADGVIDLSDHKDEAEILQEILSLMPLVDIVIDCSGCSQSINVATKALKTQGRCILAGCQSERANLNIFEAQLKEIMLIPSLWSCNKFPAAIKLLETNRAPLSELITHRYGFMESQRAFEKSIGLGDNDVIQAVVKCQKEFV